MPIVTEETIQFLLDRYGESGVESWGEYLSQVQQRIIVENPQLTRFIEIQVGQYPQELHNDIFALIVGLYTALEHQTSTNNLEKSLL
jgi:hypothetical protein